MGPNLAEKWMIERAKIGGITPPQNENLRRQKLLRVFRRCYILLS